MKEENKKRINKLVIPFTRRTLSFLTATTMIVTGTTGCKEVDNKENTSSIIISDDDISSEESIIVDTEDTTSEIASEEVTSEVEQNNASSNVSSEEKDTNPVVSNNENITSTPSVSTPSTESPEKPVETPDTPSTPEVTMPEKLTAENINDIEVFKHFATTFQYSSSPGAVGLKFQYTYNGETYYTDGEKEFQLALFLLNHKYVHKDLYNELFGNYSFEEMNKLASFISEIPHLTSSYYAKYDFELLCLDKSLGKFLSEFTDNYWVCIEQYGYDEFEKMVQQYFMTKDNSYYYGSGNVWADYYVWSLSSYANFYIKDMNIVQAACGKDGHKDYFEYIYNDFYRLYNHNRVYVKNN